MTRTDEQIRNDVLNRLNSDNRLKTAEIDVIVDGSTVILKGLVPSYLAAISAKSDTLNVWNVNDCINQLEIEHTMTLPVPADDYIESSIRKRLAACPDINQNDLEVTANGGTVILQGTVDRFWKKIHSEYLIELEPGVVGIENLLVVTPAENMVD